MHQDNLGVLMSQLQTNFLECTFSCMYANMYYMCLGIMVCIIYGGPKLTSEIIFNNYSTLLIETGSLNQFKGSSIRQNFLALLV